MYAMYIHIYVYIQYIRSKSKWLHGCCCLVAQSCPPLCDPVDCSMPASLPSPGVCSNSCPSRQWCQPSHLVFCPPLLLLTSIFPSITVFSNESVLHVRWPKHWSFSFSISPSNEYSRFASCRINWFDLLSVQETLRSLLQHHSSKAPILQCSAFFMAQLSHPYMTPGKTIALTTQTFVFALVFALQDVWL